MYTVDQIKLLAAVCTIYPDQRSRGVPGFIHFAGAQAIHCYPFDGGYVWTINGERARESAIATLLAGE